MTKAVILLCEHGKNRFENGVFTPPPQTIRVKEQGEKNTVLAGKHCRKHSVHASKSNSYLQNACMHPSTTPDSLFTDNLPNTRKSSTKNNMQKKDEIAIPALEKSITIANPQHISM